MRDTDVKKKEREKKRKKGSDTLTLMVKYDQVWNVTCLPFTFYSYVKESAKIFSNPFYYKEIWK
jgi:hypothetical protein